MLSTYFVAADPRVVATVNFAPYGHGLYFCNATEIQKFSISAAFVKQGRRVLAFFTTLLLIRTLGPTRCANISIY